MALPHCLVMPFPVLFTIYASFTLLLRLFTFTICCCSTIPLLLHSFTVCCDSIFTFPDYHVCSTMIYDYPIPVTSFVVVRCVRYGVGDLLLICCGRLITLRYHTTHDT